MTLSAARNSRLKASPLANFAVSAPDENSTFWNDVNNRRIGWIMAYSCDSGKIVWIDPAVGITTSAQFIIPEQNNELQRYEVTFAWRSKDIPAQMDAPTGIFS